MQSLKKSTIQTKRTTTDNLTNITISVFFLSILIITCVLVIFYIIFSQNQDDKSIAWEQLIREHIERYPDLLPSDVYKLVYQGTLGPAHLGGDSIKISDLLIAELAGINADTATALYENISPSGKYIRLNLKRWKATNRNPEKIVRAIIASSSTTPADSAKFVRRWTAIEKLVVDDQLPLPRAEFFAFSDSVKKAGYPVIHHSAKYIQNYQPAYRVIERRHLKLVND